MDEERHRVRSLIPLIVGVGGLGLAVAMIVDGVQKNAAASRLNQPVTTETGDATSSSEADKASLDERLDEALLEEVPLAKEAPEEVPAAKEVPLSKIDKRLIYRQAYEKARRRAPIDPRASVVAKFQST